MCSEFFTKLSKVLKVFMNTGISAMYSGYVKNP